MYLNGFVTKTWMLILINAFFFKSSNLLKDDNWKLLYKNQNSQRLRKVTMDRNFIFNNSLSNLWKKTSMEVSVLTYPYIILRQSKKEFASRWIRVDNGIDILCEIAWCVVNNFYFLQ